ncbi:Pre-rRNA-processing protein-like protein [Emericellopsis cladophorae]|uniref:Pre-rRNA-processing protein RIX1 n=1 Tax=Emericellopsis cladophorae TaxID=2686198 RepID=A0A9P9Y5X8_9HYPO|nr:Pre-rRNA-processing protein-like protein [Emericellopsis cladophorae]KAI6783940.1 Pre-rRNA-processing protein-like protein [Emericellopsis cladophorae]
MSSTLLPPDLRVLCRKLTSVPPQQLPHALPSLVSHVVRCRHALSTPADGKAKGEAAESAQLVNKLKTSITTLVNSRTREARFAAIALIKSAVDVGGWEVLRGCEPWVRGLLSIVQKGDPVASKELAIVTLTRIYALLQPYQTLVREIATPTIPAFATACVQLIKVPATGAVTSTPLSVVETICDAFSTLIPLYPATFRPSSNQTLTAIRPFLAPTETDDFSVPQSLQESARRLAATQHHVAAKSGGSEEWAKLLDGIVSNIHDTADHVLRAVDESWEPTSGNPRPKVPIDGPMTTGGAKTDDYPSWSGVHAGSQRLVGLFDFLSTCLRHSTKGAVAVPLTKLTDTVTRVCAVARLSPKSSWDQALQTKAAIGRDEKEDLWSVIPDVHMAALRLIQALFQRLGDDMTPYVSDLSDTILRVFNSAISIPAIRSTSYATLHDLLVLTGPALPKTTVDMLQPVIGATCRDLQEDAGYLKQPKNTASAGDGKKNGLAANADLFLQKPEATAEQKAVPLEAGHKVAASTLLTTLLTRLPQKHLKPSHRSLLDQTAILTSNRGAMVASVLNPYVDTRGRKYPSILPHLTQQFPQDQTLEILRTNLRPEAGRASGIEEDREMNEDEHDEDDESEDEAADDEREDHEMGDAETQAAAPLQPGTLPAAPQLDLPKPNNPFEVNDDETTTVYGGFGNVRPRESSPPKRKHQGAEVTSPKRQELETPAPNLAQPQAGVSTMAVDEDSDSGESAHLQIDLDDDSDDE